MGRRGGRLARGWIRLLLRLFPDDFRRDCAQDLVRTFDDVLEDRRSTAGVPGAIGATVRASVDLVAQAAAERRRGGIMTGLLSDLRFARRTLVRNPGLTATLILTLSLGIGGSTAIFSVVYGVLMRPLPFPDSERVVRLCEVRADTASLCVASAVNVTDLAAGTREVDAAGVARDELVVWSVDGRATSVRGAIATPGFFRALGAVPARGRLFEPADDRAGSNDVAVLSHRFWTTRLMADDTIVGRTITVDERPVRVIGVLPADAYIPEFAAADIWRPLSTSVDDVTRRGWRGFIAVARVRPDVSLDAASEALQGSYAGLRAEFPADLGDWNLRAESVRERLVAPIRPTLWVFQGAALLVLLIASANAAGLLLVRAAGRTSEFAVRSALGAGRLRLVRQLLAEGFLLSAVSAGVGVLWARLATAVVVRLAPSTIPRMQEVSVDTAVAAFAFVVAGVTTVVFGIVPARQRGDLSTTLRGQRVLTDRRRLRTATVVLQLTCAFALLLVATQLGRAFSALSDWDPGFDRDGLVITWLVAPPSVFHTTTNAVAGLTAARDAVAALPGISGVGLTSAGPLFGGSETAVVTEPAVGDAPVEWFDVDAGYFRALGAPIRRGRAFTSDDTLSAPRVAVVNEAFVRRYLPDRDPIGARVTVSVGDGYTADVVGVVNDFTPARPTDSPAPQIYWPIQQYQRFGAYLVVRSAPGAAVTDAAIRDRIVGANPALQAGTLTPLTTYLDRTLVSPRFNVVLLALFATVAVVMAAVGVFGVVAFSVMSRTREIGLRVAMGAAPRQVEAHFLGGAARLAAVSVVAGLVLAVALSRWTQHLVAGVPVIDPMVAIAGTGSFILVVVLAGWVPAHRASRIDPVRALAGD